MSLMRILVLSLLGVLATARTSGAAVVIVDSCDLVVPAGTVAALASDLSCGSHCTADHATVCQGADDRTSCAGVGGECVPDQLVLEAGARLELQGHTLRAARGGDGISCGFASRRGTCSVYGPGAIRGGAGSAITSLALNVVASDLDLEGGAHAIFSLQRVVARNVTAGPNGSSDIVGLRGLRAIGVVPGVDGMRSDGDLIAERISLRSYSGGLVAGRRLQVHELTFDGEALLSGHDVLADRIAPLDPGSPWYARLAATRSLRLSRSRLSFIGSAATTTGGEILAGRRPQLVQATCDRSYVLPGASASWGVCGDDGATSRRKQRGGNVESAGAS